MMAFQSNAGDTGLELEVVNDFGALQDRAAGAFRGALERTLQETARDAQESLRSGPKSGAFYAGHRASAPGEPPASESGALAASIQARMQGPRSGEVTATAPHAAVLEYGGLHVEARPFLGPALERAAETLDDALREALQEVTRGG